MTARGKIFILTMASIAPMVVGAPALTTFLSPQSHRVRIIPRSARTSHPTTSSPFSPTQSPTSFNLPHPLFQPIVSTTSLSMGYNLPPSNNNNNLFQTIQSVLPTIGTALLLGLFFSSPLGAAFFAIFNSLFLLALVTPFLLIAGFQIWTALFTVEAPCPSCGAFNVRAVKNDERSPSVCLNCGALSRVNSEGNGLELCNNPYDIMNEDVGSGSLFDQLFGMGGGNGVSDFTDVFGDYGGVNGSGAGGKGKEDAVKRAKRQNTIIDVDVERDD